MALTIRPMMGLVQPVQMIADVGSIRVTLGRDCVGVTEMVGTSGASNVDTAMVGSPANTIPPSSSSPILIEGSGWNVAGRDGSVGGSMMVGGSKMTGTLGGSTMVGTRGGSIMMGGAIGGSTIIGTATLLTGESGLVGELDRENDILPISADKSPSLPSLISVTVDGSLLPVFFSYPSPALTIGVTAPIPLGRPLSRLFDAATTTGGFGKGRLLGEPNPIPLSKDFTDDIVSLLSSIDGETGD
jgi:hypothetical protein